jgi:lipopolysaccharide/colanic/teichoic acid biosynthesis glycosyltransferase
MAKRLFDIVLSATGLLVLTPLMLLVAVLVRLSSSGPIFFRQERFGMGVRPFTIYKFRSMVADAPRRGAVLTCGDDPRVTTVGRLLRSTKIDELPQLFNVLRGDMSLVGPRPEVRRYVEMFPDDFREILAVRPGITDLASIEYRNEAELLGRAVDPHLEYVHRILPHKIRLAKEYRRRSSVLFDVHLILRTVHAIIRPARPLEE